MRLLYAAAALLSLSSAEAAPAPPTVHLDLSVADTALIVQVLGQVQCATVAQFEVCRHAVDLLKTIREQAQKEVR